MTCAMKVGGRGASKSAELLTLLIILLSQVGNQGFSDPTRGVQDRQMIVPSVVCQILDAILKKTVHTQYVFLYNLEL
jgi:hypothetical protein